MNKIPASQQAGSFSPVPALKMDHGASVSHVQPAATIEKSLKIILKEMGIILPHSEEFLLQTFKGDVHEPENIADMLPRLIPLDRMSESDVPLSIYALSVLLALYPERLARGPIGTYSKSMKEFLIFYRRGDGKKTSWTFELKLFYSASNVPKHARFANL
jgi:hypothetical protein